MANLRLGFSKSQCVAYHKKRRGIGRLSPDRQVDEVDARLRVFRAHITEKPPQQRNLHRTVLASVIGKVRKASSETFPPAFCRSQSRHRMRWRVCSSPIIRRRDKRFFALEPKRKDPMRIFRLSVDGRREESRVVLMPKRNCPRTPIAGLCSPRTD